MLISKWCLRASNVKENTVPRTLISALRILLEIIFLVTWKENLDKVSQS